MFLIPHSVSLQANSPTNSNFKHIKIYIHSKFCKPKRASPSDKEKIMKKTLSVILSAALTLPNVCALAAEDISVSALYDANSNKVTINGTSAPGDVIIIVKDSSYTGEYTPDNLPYDFLSVKSTGDFETIVTLNEDAGGKKLSVVVTDSDGDTAQTTFMNPDFSSVSDIIDSLNDASSEKEFSKLLSDNASSLGIDTEDELYKSEKDDIFGVMYAIIKDDATGADVYDTYYKAHALVSLNGKNEDEVRDILKTSASVLGIDYVADYESDSRLTDDAKEELCKLLSKADYSKVLSVSESFGDFLEKTKAVAAISTAKKWQDIKTVMEEDFADLFTLTESGSKAQKIYSKMMNYDYSDFDDIKDGYKKAKKALEDSSESSGGTSSSPSYGSSAKLPTGIEISTDVQTPSQGDSGNLSQKQEMITLPSSGSSNFIDVPSDHWSYNAVSVLSDAGVVSGYPDGTFGKDASITRAEFAKLVCIAFGIPSAKADFDDVDPDAWYNGYVGGGAKYGLITGYGETFGPNDFISRQDAAVIIYRALKNEGIVLNGDAFYDDNMDISLYAITAVGALRANDIMIGSNSKFLPKNNITRAEAAQLIFKAVVSANNR